MPDPQVSDLLQTAVEALGGTERAGQVEMANAVADAMAAEDHLLVQAGTGTGKSLAYLIPAFAHTSESGRPVVVATATLALQAQLVGRDLPSLVEAIGTRLKRQPSYAIFKGRHNYACLHRVRDGVPDDQGALIDAPPTGPAGRQVLALREWADKQAKDGGSGDRDEAPTHQDRAWAQVSVSARECMGDRCAYSQECFSERARNAARTADLVITNHALLAIDAIENRTVLPDHDIVVIDEAHELAARVTGAASAELSHQLVSRAARRARPFCDGGEADPLEDAADGLNHALDGLAAGRLDELSSAIAEAVAVVRDSARAASSAFPRSVNESDREAPLRAAKAGVDQVHNVAERIAEMSPNDVVWIAEREQYGPQLQVAPLSVAGLLRNRVLADRTCVLTSATLKLGGDFDAAARSVGLRADEAERPSTEASEDSAAPESEAENDEPMSWRGVDVGTPFDYAKQAIFYVARRLPKPERGISERALDELCDLVGALGGRTLGLFSSRRAAEEAAAVVRDKLGLEVLCQGDGQLTELQRKFVADQDSSLFGTLSLWQGLDVPGETCQLVVIDRIPFPRPDDPLMSARQRAIDDAGGNGFLTVAATHAALLLAQGVGRLIRRSSDRGVVAVLDSRLATARYGGFLRASLPPMWYTPDHDVVVAALSRLRETT